MASIRAKLTTAYAGALIGTMALFAVALYAARRAGAYRDLEVQVFERAELAHRIIHQAAEGGEPVTVEMDTLIGPTVTPRLRDFLEGIGDYVLLLDAKDRTIYASLAVRQLNEEDQVTLARAAIRQPASAPARWLQLRADQLLLGAVREVDANRTGISRVVAAVSTRPAELAPRELVVSMLVIAPFILLVSFGGAYYIAGRAFRPVGQLINQVEAITDGRSLHRRVAAEDTGDEIARLGATLNAMLGRLETSFGALRRFTADASHELKTPLTVLRANVERAMSHAAPPGEKLVALEEALHEITRTAGLVDSLLTLARADEGRFDLHREPVEMEPLVREVFETAVILGEVSGLAVTMPLVEPVTLMGDRTRLRHLFLNLVTNAIKYTPSGGKVEVTLSRRLDAVTFSVRDTGIGIAAADLPYIFERFWRADRARSRRAAGDGRAIDERGGFGLGLAISQYIAQAHGGSITVTSRLGRGSTFTVTLPIGEPAPAAPPAESASEPERARGDAGAVLHS